MPTADGGSQTKELEETKKTVVWSYCSGSSKVGMYSVVMPVSSVQGKKKGKKREKGRKSTVCRWFPMRLHRIGSTTPLFFPLLLLFACQESQDVTCVGVRGVRGVIIRGTFFFCDPYSVFRTE